MITYKVVTVRATAPAPYNVATIIGYSVVAKESGVVIAGPFAHKGMALAEANLRASAAPGNRVES